MRRAASACASTVRSIRAMSYRPITTACFETHHSWPQPQRVPDASAARLGGICDRRHRDDDPAPPAPRRRARLHRRRLRHSLARTLRRAGRMRLHRRRLTPEILLAAYAVGVFPMAESADDPELFWVDPEDRGIIPL